MIEILHRGDIDRAQENSLDAIVCDHELVETDVMCLTKDLYLVHDPELKRVTGRDIDVRDINEMETRPAIKKTIQYNSRELSYTKERNITTLREVLTRITGTDKRLCLDLKPHDTSIKIDDEILDVLVDLISTHKSNIMYVSSFNIDILQRVRDRLSGVDIGLFMSTDLYDPKSYLESIDPMYLIYSKEDIDSIDSTDEEHIKVVYTIPKDRVTDYIDEGIDYIIIDNR